MLVGALPMLAALGGIVSLVVKIEEGGDGGIRLQDHAAAVPSVTTVGTAAGNELLAPEADTAGPPVATLDEDVDLVNEHGVAYRE
jgi:hypothetical protein